MFLSKKKKKEIMGTSCKGFLFWSLYKRRYGCVAVLFLFQVILIVLFAVVVDGVELHSLLLYGHIFSSQMAYIFNLMAQLLIRPIQLINIWDNKLFTRLQEQFTSYLIFIYIILYIVVTVLFIYF